MGSGGGTMTDKRVFILYQNHRNETGWRTIIPIRIHFGSNEWHRAEQWLLDAWDDAKQAERTFAMRGIFRWEVA